ncbi:hypothetical protein Tco_0584411 [Tanacetum coccineum]
MVIGVWGWGCGKVGGVQEGVEGDLVVCGGGVGVWGEVGGVEGRVWRRGGGEVPWGGGRGDGVGWGGVVGAGCGVGRVGWRGWGGGVGWWSVRNQGVLLFAQFRRLSPCELWLPSSLVEFRRKTEELDQS